MSLIPPRRFLSFEELDTARLLTHQQADEATQRADRANQRTRRVLELVRRVRLGQATTEELAELEQLESEPLP
jgi:hypothetical protein